MKKPLRACLATCFGVRTGKYREMTTSVNCAGSPDFQGNLRFQRSWSMGARCAGGVGQAQLGAHHVHNHVTCSLASQGLYEDNQGIVCMIPLMLL